MKQVHLYGGKLEDGQTVTIDHSVQVFTVTIRSGCGIHSQTLKDHLQKKWEVTHITENDRTDYCL